MTPDQLALLADTRLSREARLIGLYVSAVGRDPQEVPHDTWRKLLGRGGRGGPPKDATIAGYISELKNLGWVDQNTKTGRGHSPEYTFRPPSEGGANEEIAPLLRRGLNLDPTRKGGPSTDGYPPSGGLNAPTTSSSVLPPPPPPLQAQAREFIEGSDSLVGCRDSLADYLTERVDPIRQLAYAQSVAGIIEGTDEATWLKPDGSHHSEDRPKIIAGCLNEIRSGDEVGQYFPGPPGDIRNLKSKIRYQVKSIAGAKRDARRRDTTDSRRDPGEARSQTSRSRNQAPDVHVHR